MACILLAAGASSRMGARDKLMEPVRGLPLIADRAECLSQPGHEITDVIVVLRGDRPARRAALESLRGVTLIDAPFPDEGMGSSIAVGISVVPEWSTAALIMPADMPGISQDDIHAMRQAHEQNPRAILRGATPDGRPGHPVLFPRKYFAALAQLSGDQGAREVLNRHMDMVEHVTIPSDGAILDLDTPDAWDSWHARET